MSPDKLTVTLRPRNGWEAIDLGIRLAQRCGAVLLGSSVSVVFLVALIGFLVFDVALNKPGWSLFCVWWLKPLYDRLHLHALSRAVFDETPSVRNSLRALPNLMFRTGLFPALTWRRLSPQRAVCLPVSVLEGLRGLPSRARRRLLTQRVGGNGMGLIFCFSMLETILIIGSYALVFLLIPNDPATGAPSMGRFFEHLFWGDADEAMLLSRGFQLFVYAMVVACLEPFYVAGGFGLYLKRRTDLEAWDIELQFRRLPVAKALMGVVLVGAMLGAGLGMPKPAMAQVSAEQKREQAARKADVLIKGVLSRPEFGYDDISHEWHWRSSGKAETKKPKKATPPFSPPAWLKSLLDLLGMVAGGIRTIVYGLLAVCLGFILWWVLRQVKGVRLRRRKRVPPAEIMGMDIRPESLPSDIAEAARALFAQGQTRQALALLYRGALSYLAHQDGIPFEVGDTEGDCMLRVMQARSAARPGFSRLTMAWQAVAYARRRLSLEDGYALCQIWRQSFGGAR